MDQLTGKTVIITGGATGIGRAALLRTVAEGARVVLIGGDEDTSRQAVAAAVVLWLLVVVFWRYSSLGSISAAVALPLFVYLLYAPGHAPPEYVTIGTVVISLLVLIKHRPNIARLVAGEEPRLNFGGKK